MAPSTADQPSNNAEPPRGGGAELTVPTLGELVRTTAHLGAIGYAGVVLFSFGAKTPELKPTLKSGPETAAVPKPERLSVRGLVPAVVVAAIVAVALIVPHTRDLMATFLGIGATAFGGGFGSIPLIPSQVVDAHGWLTTKEFVDGIALGQITPGPVFITATSAVLAGMANLPGQFHLHRHPEKELALGDPCHHRLLLPLHSLTRPPATSA